MQKYFEHKENSHTDMSQSDKWNLFNDRAKSSLACMSMQQYFEHKENSHSSQSDKWNLFSDRANSSFYSTTVLTRGKVLSWEYRSPRKRNSRPSSTNHCPQAVLLLIYYRKTKVKDGCLKFVYNIKIPGLRRCHRKTLTYLPRAYVSVYTYSLEVFPVSRNLYRWRINRRFLASDRNRKRTWACFSP